MPMFEKLARNCGRGLSATALLAMTVTAVAAEPGASVDESRVDVQLYVDVNHPEASDTDQRAGRSADRPLASISQGLAVARDYLRDGQAVRVSIGPGLYRETVDFQGGDEGELRATLLIVEGDPDGGTIISGATPEGVEPDAWRPVPDQPNLYERAWTDQRGITWGPWGVDYGVHYAGVAARSEMLFVDDRRLTPVELEVYEWYDPSKAEGDDEAQATEEEEAEEPRLVYRGLAEAGWGVLSEPWQFAVADHDDTPEPFRKRIVMRLPEGVTPTDFDSIETGAAHSFGVQFRGKDNLVIRDLTIQHFATHFLDTSFSLTNCNNTLVDRVTVREVSGRGMGLGMSDRVTIRDSQFVHAGQRGFGGTRFTNTLIKDSDFSFNNWRGVLAGFTGWDTGATKITRAHNVLYLRCTAIGNDAHGFWTDIFNRNVVYDRCLSYGNLGRGFFFELSGRDEADGDERAINCVSAYNSNWGFMLMNVRRTAVEQSLALNNTEGQFALHQSGQRHPHDAEGFEFKMVRDSHAISQNRSPVVGIPAWGEWGGDDLFAAARLDGNTYASNEPDKALWRQGRDRMSLAQWQSQLAERGTWEMNDQNSTMTRVPAYDDEPFDLTDPDSPIVRQIRDMGVPLPFEAMGEVTVPRRKD